MAPEGHVLGMDYAGIVVEAGSEVTHVKKFDRVAGWIHGGSLKPMHGAFAQYITADGDNLFRIPENVTFDVAATIAVGFQTAAMGLYKDLKLPFPNSPLKEPIPILIWGGSSAVGFNSIQLAKLAGYTVIATASPKNFLYLKSIGADHVFSYADPNTPAEIKKVTGGKLYQAYDTISANGSTQGVLDSFGSDVELPTGVKKKISITNPVKPEELDDKAKGVEIQMGFLYTFFGKEVTVYGVHLEANAEDYAFSKKTYALLEQLLVENKIEALKVDILGGLEKVSEGLDLLRQGKTSAIRLGIHPQETKL
jgi:NADPH:quinone reductase-like Zn-dependent oxidoreductase